MSDGGPAFPIRDDEHLGACWVRNDGMTLRDYFAAKAMGGLLGNPEFRFRTDDGTTVKPNFGFPWFRQALAVNAYDIADAMLAEREKRKD